jgi:hypothetical protein
MLSVSFQVFAFIEKSSYQHLQKKLQKHLVLKA